MTVEEQVKIQTAVFTWKMVHGGKPARLLERMEVQDDYKILVDGPRLQYLRAYRWRATQQWNTYSQELRQEPSIAKFKNAIKRKVIQKRNWDPGD